MNANLLAISVGNTRTKIGTFVAGKLVATRALENKHPGTFLQQIEEAHAPLDDLEDVGIVLASVNAPVTERVIADIAKALGSKVFRVEHDLPIPVGRQLDPEALVGEDRLVNAAAAYDTLKQACVIIDAGTALVVDFVDGAGTFHGGAIAPGAQMMLDALHRGTAQLPDVKFSVPAEPVGHNTTQAMLAGVYHGMRGMVRELVEQYAQVAGAYPMVIATGGNAEELFKDFDIVERLVPDLTLLGLAVTWNYALKDQDDIDSGNTGRSGLDDDDDSDDDDDDDD